MDFGIGLRECSHCGLGDIREVNLPRESCAPSFAEASTARSTKSSGGIRSNPLLN
jgi:hypothetical protein